MRCPSRIAPLLIVPMLLAWATESFAQASKNRKVEAGEESSPSYLFPDWNPDAFDFRIGPVIGYHYRKTEISGVEYETASSEIGLAARVPGIPLFPGNPGVTIEPYATYTWGSRNQKAKAENLNETESTGYRRFWYGGQFKLYLRSFRYALDIGKGAIRNDKELFIDYDADRMENDFGLKVLPFLSAHYTLTNYKLTEEDDSSPTIEEIDHWVHARMQFIPFSLYLDVGPGHTRSTYRTHLAPNTGLTKLGTGETDYLKALAGLHIFWKLGASASAKYILDADDVGGVLDAIDQLPNEALNQRRSLASLPKGSMEASAFFGLSDLFAGFGVGWQYYFLEIKGKNGQSQVSRDQGFAITYQAAL